jgi:membrane protease YdiL (CAAX protease family)
MNWNWPSVWSDERGGWWRVLVTYLVIRGVAFILGALFVLKLQEWRIQDAVQGASAGVTAGVQMFLWVFPLCLAGLGCLLGVRFIHRKAIRCVFTDGRPFGFGLLFQSMAVWSALGLIGVVLFPGGMDELSQRYHELRPSSWPGYFLALFCIITFQAATEEITDRGYLQTRVAAWVKRPWIAVCISTTVFTLLHTGEMTEWARLRIAAIGFVLGVALIRANTIAPLIGMHAADNALVVIWLPERSNANINFLVAAYTCIQLAIWLAWLFWVTKPKSKTDIAGEGKNETVARA